APVFVRIAVPSLFVPMKFPVITLPEAVFPPSNRGWIRTLPGLAEMTLRSAGAVPPMVLFEAVTVLAAPLSPIKIPAFGDSKKLMDVPLPAATPAVFTPIQQPATVLLLLK